MSWIEQWQKEYHGSHLCDPGPCMCKCGCKQEMGCRAMGGLCSVCHVRYLRDDDEHGFEICPICGHGHLHYIDEECVSCGCDYAYLRELTRNQLPDGINQQEINQ